MGDVVPFNPWDLEDNDEYDPDEFYCGSVDRNGHHAGLNIGIKPNISARIDELVASKMFPAYKTKGHFARDAMVHRLHYLADRARDSDLLRFVKIEMHAAKLEADRYEHERLTKLLEDYDTLLRMKRDANDQRGLAAVVDRAVVTANDLDSPWDNKLLELANRYAR